MDVIVPPQILMYVGIITAVIQVLKKTVPAIGKLGYLLPFLSIGMGVGVGLVFMPGETAVKVSAGIMCGLAASGLFDAASSVSSKEL